METFAVGVGLRDQIRGIHTAISRRPATLGKIYICQVTVTPRVEHPHLVGAE
jgi:hypothetical protein